MGSSYVVILLSISSEIEYRTTKSNISILEPA